MSILKALQKKQNEQPRVIETADSARVVPFDKNGRRANTPPELLAQTEFKIGTPSLAFNGQTDSQIGKALPDFDAKNSAGATLNAVGSTRIAEKRLPEFASWNVEAERVEPRLIAITQPNSTYCEEYRSLRTQVLHKSHGRQIIEEVADNLDLLPRNEALLASDKAAEKIRSARILTGEAREELWKHQSRIEVAGNPKRFSSEAAHNNSSVKHDSFTSSDDEISLEF
jgi:hypothetical protein